MRLGILGGPETDQDGKGVVQDLKDDNRAQDNYEKRDHRSSPRQHQ